MSDAAKEQPQSVNYYTIIKKYLNRIYKDISQDDCQSLCREVIFAPNSYMAEIKDTPVPITAVRKNLAESIERDNAAKNFIPYSLDTELADLIEKNNCETSSMNEYYRWVSATLEIVRKTTDGEITKEDIKERKDFITMSFDREAEILLCLALYEGAGNASNKEKINMLRFKLARLREMRSIVSLTPNKLTAAREKKHLAECCAYCLSLLKEKTNFSADVNSKLNLINNHIKEDLEEDFSCLDYLRQIVLYMMRRLEKTTFQNNRSENAEENAKKELETPLFPATQKAIER